MTRGILLLALVSLSTAADVAPDCVLDSSDALTDGINAAMDIWAATKRCGQSPVKCAQDISQSIKDVTSLANAVAGMVSQCGTITLSNAQCGLDANRLISATAGLSANAAGIADKCAGVGGPGAGLDLHTALGECTADGADSMNSIFEASNALQKIKEKCNGGSCAINSLEVVDVLTSFGSYIAAAVNDCSGFQGDGNDNADCASGILGSVAQLSKLSEIGLEMKHSCGTSSSRLYRDIDNKVATTTASPLALALAAILPITAVLSFLAGSRFAKNRQQRDAELQSVE